MSDHCIQVSPVRTSRQRRAFLQLPWQLYANDRCWIPPLRNNEKELLGFRRHPFYLCAEIQTFLATRDGHACGRIAAIVDHAHNRHYEEQRGMFGFFESVDDVQVARQLFETAKQWLEAKGIRRMRGPVNPSMNYTCGTLIEGFDSPPCFMMTYNPPFYERLIEGFGFAKAQDMYAFYGNIDMLGNINAKLAYLAAEALRRFGVETRHMDRSRFRQEIKTFLQIYNASLPSQWGFVPMSDREVEHLARGLRHLINPTLTCLAEVDKRPVGLVFALPDYNPVIRQIDGKLYPFGFIKLLRARNRITRCRLINANIRPEFQRWGLILGLFSKVLPIALEKGYKEVEFSWVLESNQLSRGSLEKGGAKRYKTYRIYDNEW